MQEERDVDIDVESATTAEEPDVDADRKDRAEGGDSVVDSADRAAPEHEETKQESPVADDAIEPPDESEKASAEETDTTPKESQDEVLKKVLEEARLYKDRWVRLAAEFDNYKKRTSREFSVLIKNAGESLIAEMLPILDNVERALEAPQTAEETRQFAQGVEMIHQQFIEKLEKAGMQEIKADGKPFDPTRHEAVMAVENADHPAHTVLNVVEKGYLLNEKVLRAAKVIVTRLPAEKPLEEKHETKQNDAEDQGSDNA